MNRQQIESYIKENLNGSSSIRTNCPNCGNRNTFVASIQDGQILYYCYHAFCNTKGKTDYVSTLQSLRQIRSIDNQISSTYILPDYFVNPLQNPRCYAFLKYWRLLEAYASGVASIFYDPKLDRCVFLLKDHKGDIYGAVGRSLDRNNLPRWYVYDRINKCPFISMGYGKGNILSHTTILVEDALSSIRVASICNGVGLLGTSFHIDVLTYINPITKYAWIALDKDATHKSLKIQKQLAPYIDSRILPLEKDIKYYSETEMEQLKGLIS